jgi:hypothetical protein
MQPTGETSGNEDLRKARLGQQRKYLQEQRRGLIDELRELTGGLKERSKLPEIVEDKSNDEIIKVNLDKFRELKIDEIFSAKKITTLLKGLSLLMIRVDDDVNAKLDSGSEQAINRLSTSILFLYREIEQQIIELTDNFSLNYGEINRRYNIIRQGVANLNLNLQNLEIFFKHRATVLEQCACYYYSTPGMPSAAQLIEEQLPATHIFTATELFYFDGRSTINKVEIPDQDLKALKSRLSIDDSTKPGKIALTLAELQEIISQSKCMTSYVEENSVEAFIGHITLISGSIMQNCTDLQNQYRTEVDAEKIKRENDNENDIAKILQEHLDGIQTRCDKISRVAEELIAVELSLERQPTTSRDTSSSTSSPPTSKQTLSLAQQLFQTNVSTTVVHITTKPQTGFTPSLSPTSTTTAPSSSSTSSPRTSNRTLPLAQSPFPTETSPTVLPTTAKPQTDSTPSLSSTSTTTAPSSSSTSSPPTSKQTLSLAQLSISTTASPTVLPTTTKPQTDSTSTSTTTAPSLSSTYSPSTPNRTLSLAQLPFPNSVSPTVLPTTAPSSPSLSLPRITSLHPLSTSSDIEALSSQQSSKTKKQPLPALLVAGSAINIIGVAVVILSILLAIGTFGTSSLITLGFVGGGIVAGVGVIAFGSMLTVKGAPGSIQRFLPPSVQQQKQSLSEVSSSTPNSDNNNAPQNSTTPPKIDKF